MHMIFALLKNNNPEITDLFVLIKAGKIEVSWSPP